MWRPGMFQPLYSSAASVVYKGKGGLQVGYRYVTGRLQVGYRSVTDRQHGGYGTIAERDSWVPGRKQKGYR
mgnify:CR=1 FL=1